MAENLWTMRGIVRDRKPNAAPSLVDGFLNSRIQRVINKRSWSDLLKVTMVGLPDSYKQGTVSLAAGSNIAAGTDTFWPVNDAVSTSLTDAALDSPGYLELKPAVLTGINPGDFLYLDAENPELAEVVTVQSVTNVSFKAYCRYTHDAGVSIQKSRFAGLQLKVQNQIFTVQGVLDPSTIQLDMQWGGAPVVNGGYFIYKAYVQISKTARRIKFAWDPTAGQAIGVDKTVQWLQLFDPQRSSSGNPRELCQAHPGPGGIAQWEIWPLRTAAYAFPIMYVDGWPKLEQDEDISPPFISHEIFVAGASADAFSTPIVANGAKGDPMLNPIAAQRYDAQYAEMLEDAIQQDEARFAEAFQNYRQMMMRASTQWIRGHAVPMTWPSDY